LCKLTYLIAKPGRPHTNGKTLIKTAIPKLANIMLQQAFEVNGTSNCSFK